MEKSKERRKLSRTGIIIIVSSILLLGVIVSCVVMFFVALNKPYRYKGDHIDLFSVATNNLFGATGYQVFEFADFHPFIDVLETDDYGRTLFFFTQDTGQNGTTGNSVFGTAIFVMQKSDKKSVYFYQDDCYTPYRMPKGLKSVPKDYRNDLPEDDIKTLKERNDWNREMNLEKCTKAKISDNDPNGKLKAEKCESTIKSYAKQNGYKGDDSLFRYGIFCNADAYGRELYYVYAVGRDVLGQGVSPTSKEQDYEFAIIFTPDNSCSIDNICEVSSDSLDYYEKVMELKKTAHWNQPIAK